MTKIKLSEFVGTYELNSIKGFIQASNADMNGQELAYWLENKGIPFIRYEDKEGYSQVVTRNGFIVSSNGYVTYK